MRLWILSDLHLEYADLRTPLTIPDADVCVVAGDLCRAPANGVHWLAEHIAPAMPCIYVAGNHEFYKGSIREGIEDGRTAATQVAGVHFLENDTVTIGGITFIGATLWTDAGSGAAAVGMLCGAFCGAPAGPLTLVGAEDIGIEVIGIDDGGFCGVAGIDAGLDIGELGDEGGVLGDVNGIGAGCSATGRDGIGATGRAA